MSIPHAELIPTSPTVADQVVEAGRDMAQSQHRLVTLAAEFEATVMRRPHEATSPNEVGSATEGGEHASADASASLAQQRADAFVELVTDGGASVETEVVVHVRSDGCSYDDGTPLTDTVVERLAPVEETRIRCAPCHRRRHERARRGRGPRRD